MKKHSGLIKVVTGIRRCGKSYLLFSLFKKHLLESVTDENHIIKHSKRYYIQSAFAIPDSEKMRQESNSLLRINDSFKKLIVVKDALAPTYIEDGILVVGVYDFLLNENSLEI